MALIQYLTQIQFEFGAVKLLGSECERVGITRPLIVTDAGVKACRRARRRRWMRCGGLPSAVFDQTPSNPTEAAVRAAAAVYREAGCDGLIAVGGGSCHRLRQGCRHRGHARRPSQDLRDHRRWLAEDHRSRGAAHRRAHHQRHWQRGGARRDRDRGRSAASSASTAGTWCPRPRSATPSSRWACPLC
jgi:hypothetical protein